MNILEIIGVPGAALHELLYPSKSSQLTQYGFSEKEYDQWMQRQQYSGQSFGKVIKKEPETIDIPCEIVEPKQLTDKK